MTALFTILFLSIFLFEGLGIPGGRQLSYNIILASPFLLFVTVFRNKKEILFPQTISLFFVIFLLLSLVSVLFSANLQQAFEYFLLYFACFFGFIFAYNNKEELKKLIVPLLFFLSTIFALYSLLLPYLLREFPGLLPQTGYQLVYASFGHNHLGDFLLLPIGVCLYYVAKQKTKLSIFFFLLFFLPFFILSLSRAAYSVAIFIFLLILLQFFSEGKIRKTSHVIFILLIIISSLSFFLVAFTSVNRASLTERLNAALSQGVRLNEKTFFSGRDKYTSEAIISILHNPVLGVGGGNFIYSSIRYQSAKDVWSETAHNIFLDVVSENGIPALLSFAAIIFFVVKTNFRKREPLWYIFLTSLLLFQLDYVHRLFSWLFMFFLLLGLFAEEKKEESFDSRLLLPAAFLLLFFSFIMLASNKYAENGQYKFARTIYPLNKRVYPPLITSEAGKGDFAKASSLLSFYESIFPSDPSVHIFVGDSYLQMRQNKYALVAYQKAYEENKYIDLDIVKKIYTLKREQDGQQQADSFLERLFSDHIWKQSPAYFPDYRIETIRFCQEVYNYNCPYDL